MSTLLLLATAVLAVLGFFLAIGSLMEFWKIVRRRDPDLWERLGRPTGIRYSRGQSSDQTRARAYIRRKKYKELGEPELERLIRRSRCGLILIFVVCVLLELLEYYLPDADRTNVKLFGSSETMPNKPYPQVLKLADRIDSSSPSQSCSPVKYFLT